VTINNSVQAVRSGYWNENNLNPLSSINWRASLVPAAAVIPAPIAYIKVVAVKKLVVGFLVGVCVPDFRCSPSPAILGWTQSGIKLLGWRCPSFTVKKLECSKQAYAVEYISME
jgi:hypothetical protein